jgi:hypothetical protein
MGATRLSAFFFWFFRGRDGVSPSAARNMRALPVDGVESSRRRGDVTRNTALKIVNPVLGLLVLNQIVTGIFIEFLPEGASELHEWGGYLFVGVAVAHIALNWNWVKATFFRKKPAVKAGA